MLKKHIVLFESKHYGWIAYSITGSKAKRILSVNKYKEENFEEKDKYIIISYESVDKDICFDTTNIQFYQNYN